MDAFATARYGLITKWVGEIGRTGVVYGCKAVQLFMFDRRNSLPWDSHHIHRVRWEFAGPTGLRVTSLIGFLPHRENPPSKSSKQILQANPPSKSSKQILRTVVGHTYRLTEKI